MSASAIAAAQAYMAKHTDEKHLLIRFEAEAAGYARLRLVDPSGQNQELVGYAKKGLRDSWTILAFGTDFDRDFFRKHPVPEHIRVWESN